MAYTAFAATYSGNKCWRCNNEIAIGQMILKKWSRRHKGRTYYVHDTCNATPASEPTFEPQNVPVLVDPAGEPSTPVYHHAHDTAALSVEPSTNGHSNGHAEPTGLAETLAAALLPHIESKLALKADKDELGAFVESKVSGLLETVNEMLNSRPSTIATLVVTRPEPLPTLTIDHPHPQLPTLIQLLQAGKHVYLYGAPGGGKSTAAAQACEALGIDHALLCLNPQLPPSAIFGYKDANGEYQGTPFRGCYETGGGAILDELDNSAAALQAMLNGALANGRSNFADGNVSRHQAFRCVGTGNTNGLGGNRAFPDRRPMDGAFRDRFAFVEWAYDEQWERSVALTRNADCGAWIDWVIKVRCYCTSAYPTLQVTPRASFDGADLLAAGFNPETVAHMAVFKGFDRDSVTRILGECSLPKVRA